jgi:hypothetical protein
MIFKPQSSLKALVLSMTITFAFMSTLIASAYPIFSQQNYENPRTNGRIVR